LIGDTLDAAERDKYQLLTNLSGFEWAVFYLNPDSSLKVEVSLLEKGVRRDTTIARYRTVRAVRNQIRQLAEGNPATQIYRDLQRDIQAQNKLQQFAERARKPEGPVAKVYAQEVKDKVVILSPRVGSAIDAAERERYELFPEVRHFDRAVFLQTPEKTYYAKIMFIGPDGAGRDTTVQYSEDTLSVLAERIEHFEELKQKTYHIGERPAKIRVVERELRPKEEAAQWTQGTDVVVLLTSGQEIEGELVSVRDSSVLIAAESGRIPPGLPAQVHGILAIKDTMVTRFVVQGSSNVFLGMGLGLLGGIVVGGAIGAISYSPPARPEGVVAAIVWPYVEQTSLGGAITDGMLIGAVVGTAAGAVVGAAASETDIEVGLSVPAERSALKKLARYPDKEPEFLEGIK
jgi:hypothetical protein